MAPPSSQKISSPTAATRLSLERVSVVTGGDVLIRECLHSSSVILVTCKLVISLFVKRGTFEFNRG